VVIADINADGVLLSSLQKHSCWSDTHWHSCKHELLAAVSQRCRCWSEDFQHVTGCVYFICWISL